MGTRIPSCSYRQHKYPDVGNSMYEHHTAGFSSYSINVGAGSKIKARGQSEGRTYEDGS